MTKRAKEVFSRIAADIKACTGIAVIFVLYYLMVHFFHTAFCPMIRLTGVPCAGCGLTRAMLFLLTGQMKRAFFINPMIFPITAFLLYCGYFRYIRGIRVKGFNLILGCLIAAMIIVYLWRMYLYFPDRTPYVYTGHNLLADRIPVYRQWIGEMVEKLRALRNG